MLFKRKPALLHFKFDRFADLSTEFDDGAYSDSQTDCNGYKWYLELLPGGDDASSAAEGWVGLHLWNESFSNGAESRPLDARFSLAAKDADGAIYCETHESHFAVDDDRCSVLGK